jgi:hypothetical protein
MAKSIKSDVSRVLTKFRPHEAAHREALAKAAKRDGLSELALSLSHKLHRGPDGRFLKGDGA